MRYIGNKIKILSIIDTLLEEKGLDVQGLTFCDAFTGTASVAHHYKDRYRIIANDNLYFAYVIAEAKLNSDRDMFVNLGFNPFEFVNNDRNAGAVGFISENYSPEHSGRMYFSDENARLIDYIRIQINLWYNEGLIDIHEKYFLIASLIESASKVANVAGVYGAYLKDWDPRAVKRMVFQPIDFNPHVAHQALIYNKDVLDIMKDVEGDILYLDPPYTRNQYSVQYHLPETIAKYDNPVVNGITGARNMKEWSSDFSRDGNAHVAFEKLISEAKFRHIIVSYSSDGIMSKGYIENVLKRHGKKDTFSFVKLNYRRYKNSRAEDKKDHCEYLFYIEKKDKADYASPLNFIGGKYDMVDFLRQNMPDKINTFYDLFAGGFNVGINVRAEKIVYNDINYKVKELLEYIAVTDTVKIYKYIKSTIKRLNLSKEDKDAYLKLRDKYNASDLKKRDCRDLFLLIMFGFQQQIRFNSLLDYNNPVGQAGFNDKILEKLISYSRIAKEKNIVYHSRDYSEFEDEIKGDDFVYIDPPYLITLGSYNDGKRGFFGWNEKEELRLLNFLDKLNERKIKFMLSNVFVHKDRSNTILKEWVEKNNYKVIYYPNKARGKREEIIIINYGD